MEDMLKVIQVLQSIDQKLEYQNKLLETWVEGKDEIRHGSEMGKKMIKEQMDTIMGILKVHPMFKSNPEAVQKAMDNITKQMGGLG